MKKNHLASTWPLILCVCLLIAPGLGLAGTSEPDPHAFRARFETPPLGSSERADGMARVTLEGHETRERREGAPDLPVRTLLVAIPLDAVPRLEVERVDEREVSGLRPLPVGRTVHRLGQAGREKLNATRGGLDERFDLLRRAESKEYRADPEFYDAPGTFPEQAAWLGRIGMLRDQRFVELHLAPVRYDGASGTLRVAAALEVTVHFDGDARESSADPALDRFESVYLNALANYEQGRAYRRPAANPISESARAVGGGPAPFKIKVQQNGIVRLDYPTLVSSGIAALDPNPQQWRLTNRGQTVPLHIGQNPGGDDALIEPGEWVQFYGQALDDEPDTTLNTDLPGTPTDLFDLTDYTDTNVYFLELGTGIDQPQLAAQNATPACGGCATPTYFVDTRREEVDEVFSPLGGADPWYWGPYLSSNYPPSSRSIEVALPGLYSGGDAASVMVRMKGVSPYSEPDDAAVNPDHLTRITLRNDQAQTLAVDQDAFDGRILHSQFFEYDGSGDPWTDPVQLQIEALPLPALVTNDLLVDYVVLTYKRSFIAVDDRFEFEWPDATQEFVVGGLSTTTNLEVYELSDASPSGVVTPTRLTGVEIGGVGAPYSVRFRIANQPGDAPRRFLVVAGSMSVPGPAELFQDTVSNHRDGSIQADLIVIAHPDVLDLGAPACSAPNPSGCLPELLAYRATAAGGGLTSRVVLLEDLQDEFNFGLEGAGSVQEFLRWVMSDAPGEGWAWPKPAYVMLLGDASFATKDGPAAGNFVPTQIMFKDLVEIGYYASDNSMAAVVGDDELADLVIGRIPSRSVAESNRMLAKVLAYETSAPPGDWRKHALFISDRGHLGNNPSEAWEFQMINDLGASYIPRPPYTSRTLHYYDDYFTLMNAAAARSTMNAQIKAAINGTDGFSDGAALVQYIGHGNFYVWSDDSFLDERNPLALDTEAMVNGLRLPFVLAHNCLTGGFHTVQQHTMGEDWLRREGGGGIGVFAPTGLSFNFIGNVVTQVIWDGLFGNRRVRDVGSPVLETWTRLCTQGSTEACQHYVLLGDPAQRLALRSVERPENVVATAGNAEVELDWSASATPGATYDVYRFGYLPIRIYTKLNANPIVGTSFTDSTAVNATRYYYHMVAVDPQGFQSGWTHFNQDCNVLGPDCLTAMPLNPDPPAAPTGLQVEDPGTGSALQVAWNASPENDLARYTIHYGTASGVYDQSIPLGLGTVTTIADLTPGVTYYFALSATNTSGLTSGLSGEAHDFPVEGFGLRMPAFIGTLTVRADAGDALLEWGEISVDGYGKPKSVVNYEILRGTAPTYSNANLSKIADCAAPCSSYRDSGALAQADSYFYRVRAVADDGLDGALGSEYPHWTRLTLDRSSSVPGDLLLTWEPVTSAIDGSAAQISHYLVYSSNQPFTRQAIRAGALGAPIQVGEPLLELTPPAASRFYSVLAVDVRGNMSPF